MLSVYSYTDENSSYIVTGIKINIFFEETYTNRHMRKYAYVFPRRSLFFPGCKSVEKSTYMTSDPTVVIIINYLVTRREEKYNK